MKIEVRSEQHATTELEADAFELRDEGVLAVRQGDVDVALFAGGQWSSVRRLT